MDFPVEKINENDFNATELMKIYYKPDYSKLFNKIKEIKRPIKNDILMALLDGKWHSETELIRIAKKQQDGSQFIGSVTLGTIIHSINQNVSEHYLEKKNFNGKMFYKISDNYVGLSRAAYRYQISL